MVTWNVCDTRYVEVIIAKGKHSIDLHARAVIVAPHTVVLWSRHETFGEFPDKMRCSAHVSKAGRDTLFMGPYSAIQGLSGNKSHSAEAW